MSSTKFEFTVSGVNLTEEQQGAIRESIAEAVSAALLSGMKELRASGRTFSKINLINGGEIMLAANVSQAVQQLKEHGKLQHTAGG